MKAFKDLKKGGLLIVGLFLYLSSSVTFAQERQDVGMAVEFMDHAACAYVARDKGWFKKEGLSLSTCESYVTGMALAAALARGDIQVAYICLVPAINACANAGVPLKIVAGTHRYGYGLVVNPNKVKTIKDLERPGLRIGCVREGGAVDVLLHKTIDSYGLDPSKILNKVQRINPPRQLLAIKMGRIDAAFLPEQWATMAEDYGFKMLLTAQDLWPRMQGSVLVVKEELIRKHPDIVRRLATVTRKATDWINQHPEEAAAIMARQLSITGEKVLPAKVVKTAAKFEITPEVLKRSMGRLEYTTSINPKMVQEVIDYTARLGYIKNSFKANDILDLRFLR